MKRTISLLLSLMMIMTVFTSFSAYADELSIPAPTGVKCTGVSEGGYADFVWDKVKFPPLPESVPLTAYDPAAGYTVYWSTDGENWDYIEVSSEYNTAWSGGFVIGKTYYLRARAWIKTTSRVGTIHDNYTYSNYSETVKFVAAPSDAETGTDVVVTKSKLSNPMKLKGKKVTVKYSKVKKKAQSVKRAKAMKIQYAQGKLSFEKVANKKNKKINVNKKTGKITLKKGIKKGTYKVKIKVNDSGSSKVAGATKTVKVTIIVQ